MTGTQPSTLSRAAPWALLVALLGGLVWITTQSLGVDPTETPQAESQATRAAGGNDRAHRELRPSDLPYATARKTGAEDRAERDQVGPEGETLEEHAQREPGGIGPRELVANLAQPGREH